MNHYATDFTRIGDALNKVECRLYQLDYQRRKKALSLHQSAERQSLYELLQAVYIRLVALDEVDDITLVCKKGRQDLQGATAIITFRNRLFISDQVVRHFPDKVASYWDKRISIDQFIPMSERIWAQLNEAVKQDKNDPFIDITLEKRQLHQFLEEIVTER